VFVFALYAARTQAPVIAAPPPNTAHDPFAPSEAKKLSPAALDKLLEEDDETERAERANEAERDHRDTKKTIHRKGWDFRFDAPLRAGLNARATAPPDVEARATLPHENDADRAPHAARSSETPYQLILRKDFIEKYKNRATITTAFRVVKAAAVHKPADDGDQHVAGLADEVNLPMVAEIMNAKDESTAVGIMQDSADSGDIVKIDGAWRIWCEHPPADKSPQIQDEPIPAYTNTNPDHMFEIHPVSKLATASGTIDLLGTFRPINGYDAKDADKAFSIYENLPCHIDYDASAQTVSISSKKVGYNYVEFMMEVEDDNPFLTIDGRIIRSSVLSTDGTLIHKDRRMVFVKDTPPDVAARSLKKGDKLHVLGIPRIDLAVISYRVRKSAEKPEILDWGLPYEILVVGVFGD